MVRESERLPPFRLPLVCLASIRFIHVIHLCHTFERRQILAHSLTVMTEILVEIGQDRFDRGARLP